MIAVAEAYTSGLFAASYLLNGGGYWDGFYYFRAWLVFRGRSIHHQAILDPDSLADACAARDAASEYECENVLNMAKYLYEEKTGEMMEWRSDPGDLDQDLPGEPWGKADLPRALPRLYRLCQDC